MTASVDAAATRRAQIVRASARLFHDKGFDATTVRDIAAAVGMQSGSPFYHFGSKHEILLAVMEQALSDALQRLERAAASSGSAAERFRALVRAQLGLLHESGSEFAGVMLHDWRSLPPEQRCSLYALQQRYDALWQRCLDDLRLEGRLAVDAALARRLVLGALNDTAAWTRHGEPLPDLDRLADETARLFIGGTDAVETPQNSARLDAVRAELQAIRVALGAPPSLDAA